MTKITIPFGLFDNKSLVYSLIVYMANSIDKQNISSEKRCLWINDVLELMYQEEKTNPEIWKEIIESVLNDWFIPIMKINECNQNVIVCFEEYHWLN